MEAFPLVREAAWELFMCLLAFAGHGGWTLLASVGRQEGTRAALGTAGLLGCHQTWMWVSCRAEEVLRERSA